MRRQSLLLVALLVAACDSAVSDRPADLDPAADSPDLAAPASDLATASDLAGTVGTDLALEAGPDLAGPTVGPTVDLAPVADLSPASPFVPGAAIALSGRCGGSDSWSSICGSTYCTNSVGLTFEHSTITVAIDPPITPGGASAVRSTACDMDGYGCVLAAQLDAASSLFTNARYNFKNTGFIPGTLTSTVDPNGTVTLSFYGSGPITGSLNERLTLSCTWSGSLS